MNPQQPPAEFFGVYAQHNSNTLNRSPSSARQAGFATATPGMSSVIGGGRRNQQQQQQQGLVDMSYAQPDDRFNSFDATRFDRTTPLPGAGPMPHGAFAPFGANQASWTYNGNSVNMGGSVNDVPRMRNINRRAPIHTEWTSTPDAPLSAHATQASHFYPPPAQLANPQVMLANGDYDLAGSNVHMGYGHDMPRYQEAKKESDLIPTAIVIKNIPFNVRKEVLANAMAENNLPIPYAFNYHFDQGVFRGLAFANFSSAQDTALVIQALNGYEIQGRKLRVEYKKMLPEHERERIEREKREKRGQLEEQHRGPAHQPSFGSLSGVAQRQAMPSISPNQLDMNDPHILAYYVELTLFLNDDTKEVMMFPPETSAEDRRVIHILAQERGLHHSSTGSGTSRQVTISKAKLHVPPSVNLGQGPAVGLDLHPRGLSRAATFDLSKTGMHAHQRGNNLAIPDSPSGHLSQNSLRNAKSFADLRSVSPSPSSSGAVASDMAHLGGIPYNMPAYESHYNASLAVPTSNMSPMPTPAVQPQDMSNLANNLGNLHMGTTQDNMLRAREAGPGAIGSQRPGANGTAVRPSQAERQPRNPPSNHWETGASFDPSRRANGHMQRGSDSSDVARNPPNGGSSNRY